MKQIQLTIKALSPLAIGHKKPGSVSEALDYIPGSVIRGAIAFHILELSPPDDADLTQNNDDFKKIFLSEDAAIFHNAYPAESQSQAKVIPATAVSSKTNPGFKSKGNGVFDTLIDRFCAESYGHPYDPNCPTDGGRVEPYGGFYSQQKDKYDTHSVTKRLLTRVGINRSRATSEEQVLYSIEVLNEVQGEPKKSVIYRSSILVEDEALADQLLQFINAKSHSLRLGGSTSRGLGKVEIGAIAVSSDTTIASRIQNFNDTLKQRWDTWGNVFSQPKQKWQNERKYFTLDLQGDAILAENWQRTMIISPAMLCQFANVNDSSLDLHVAYSSYDYRSGWNAAWGLKKDVDLVANKGGVYLFSTTQFYDWTNALEKLEMRGVGDRTSEGFGQIQVCNEFHLVFRENAV